MLKVLHIYKKEQFFKLWTITYYFKRNINENALIEVALPHCNLTESSGYLTKVSY